MKAIEKYAQLIEMPETCDCSECQKQSKDSARAVIEAFVEDAINEVCRNCWHGREVTRVRNGEWEHGHNVACTARHIREAARRLLEESDAK